MGHFVLGRLRLRCYSSNKRNKPPLSILGSSFSRGHSIYTSVALAYTLLIECNPPPPFFISEALKLKVVTRLAIRRRVSYVIAHLPVLCSAHLTQACRPCSSGSPPSYQLGTSTSNCMFAPGQTHMLPRYVTQRGRLVCVDLVSHDDEASRAQGDRDRPQGACSILATKLPLMLQYDNRHPKLLLPLVT